MKQQVFKGQITVFSSLLFVLIISLVGCLIQSATIHVNRSIKRADTSIALESVFAEYNQDMLKEYGIFAKVGGNEEVVNRRLWFYGAKNMEHKVKRIQLLTDNQGEMFYVQAIRSMGGKVVSIPEISENSIEEQEKTNAEELENILQEGAAELPYEDNPIESVNQLKKSNLLSLVLPKQEALSYRYVVLEELPSHRKLNKGNYHINYDTNATSKTLFILYLMQHFPNYTESSKQHSLFYEVEYILVGKSSDQENLEEIVERILSIRMASNYAYLQTDSTRKAEAEAMALALGGMIPIPGAVSAIKQAILFAWAYGESILDLRVLMRGKKVPFYKDNESWQLSLRNLVSLGSLSETNEEKESEKGMSYGDYVMSFLATAKTEKLRMRALDLMELNLGIRMDGCVTAMEIESELKLQRGIKDTFLTTYSYR